MKYEISAIGHGSNNKYFTYEHKSHSLHSNLNKPIANIKSVVLKLTHIASH